MHFTYDAPDKTCLLQGDLLERNPAISDLLRTVHPHYAHHADYHYFAVLTQSCDLVRRSGGHCKTRYITIAAVRPLRTVLERQIRRFQHSDIERGLKFCSAKHTADFTQFMTRLLNNNEDDFFYLRQEPAVGLPEDHCIFLHLSIAVRSEEHYQTLLSAKILQLMEPFQHKLGYLVGKLYARPGTQDWVPDELDEKAFHEMTEEPLEDESLALWLDQDIHKAVIQQLERLPEAERTEDALKAAIVSVRNARGARRHEVLDIISRVLSDLHVDARLVTRARSRVEADPIFKARIK